MLVVINAVGLAIIGYASSHFLYRNLIKCKIDIIQAQCQSALAIIQDLHKESQEGVLTEAQAKEIAIRSLRNVRYGENDYLFIYDVHGNNIMHGARQEREGKNFIDATDKDGILWIRMMRDVAARGGGTYQYSFPKADETEPGLKTSYTLPFTPWGWLIGTGVYTDNVEKQYRQTLFKFSAIILLIVAALSALIIRISRSISAPLSDLSLITERIAKRDFNVTIPAMKRADEVGMLARSMGFLLQEAESAERLRVEMVKAKELAEAANTAKNCFLANVSHEIRTPLTSIIGGLGVVLESKKETLSAQTLKLLKIASQNADRLLSLVNGLLDLTKIDAGCMILEAIPFSVRASLQRVIDAMQIKCAPKGLQLSIAVDESIPAQSIGDPLRFEQVLMNIVGNAVKFTDHGGVSVSARMYKAENGGEVFECAIADTGIGIPQDKLNYIFERFSQCDETTARRFGGSGLGLAIVRDLLRIMGGKIGVQSKEGVGSTFTIQIPFITVEKSA